MADINIKLSYLASIIDDKLIIKQSIQKVNDSIRFCAVKLQEAEKTI